MKEMKQRRFALVYFNPFFASVFEVESFNLKDFGRNARRLRTMSFELCEQFALGLANGDHLVKSFVCHLEGKAAHLESKLGYLEWSEDLDSVPFFGNMHPVDQSIVYE